MASYRKFFFLFFFFSTSQFPSWQAWHGDMVCQVASVTLFSVTSQLRRRCDWWEVMVSHRNWRPQLEKPEQFSRPSLKGTQDGEAEHCLASLPCSPVPFMAHVQLTVSPKLPWVRSCCSWRFWRHVASCSVMSVSKAHTYLRGGVVALSLMNIIAVLSTLS